MSLLFISENVLLFIAGFGTLQGFLLAMLIYFRPGSDRSVNLYLALYISCLSLIATTPLIEKVLTWQKSYFVEPFPFLAGPLLYLYICSFKKKMSWKQVFPHLLVFIIMFFAAWWYISSMAVKYPNEKQVPAEALRTPFALVFNLVKLLQMGLYYVLARRSLTSYQRSIQQFFSDTSRINLHWINWLTNGYILFIVTTMAVYALMYQYPQQFNLWMLCYVALLTPYIYMATFKGITQATLWQVQSDAPAQKVEEEIKEANTNAPPQEKAKLPPSDKIMDITKRIGLLMVREKLYQEPELTLQQLADKLDIPAYQVSLAINEGMKVNFYELVNGFRVEEAKRLLLDPNSNNYTILSVGFEAGFNSKTTFNTVFKKFTGLTPTEYREKQKSSSITV